MFGQFALLQKGTILQNRYEIISLLGKGGMGAVYHARHLFLKTDVAIKQTTLTGDPDFITAFRREASLLANLNHQAIPNVKDFFEENSGHFIVMELIDGEDLSTRLKELQRAGGKTLPFDDMQVIAIELLEILKYLHSRNVVHKDIKPANLKITSAGHLKLLDFGLAKGSLGMMTHQFSSLLKGATNEYAPPEQLDGETTDFRSDLFSVGATFYHLLSGKVAPHPLLERILRIAGRQPDPLILLSELNDEVPEYFARILYKSMALNPDERFDSAQEMHRALTEGVESVTSLKSFERSDSEIPTQVRRKPCGAEPSGNAHSFDAQSDANLPLSDKIIGIDLGTSFIKAAFFAGGRPQIIQMPHGLPDIPSVLAYSKENRWLTGSKAKSQLLTNAQNSFANLNRILDINYKDLVKRNAFPSNEILRDTEDGIRLVSPLAGDNFSPVQLLARLLENIKKDISQSLGERIQKVAITCPNAASTEYRFKLKEACALAGLETLRIINNSSASALAYSSKQTRDKVIGVLDFGGGAFDVAIAEIGFGVIEIKSMNGDTNLGGNDVDETLVRWMIDEFKRDQGIDLTSDRTALLRLKEAAEKAKIELSSVGETEINLPFIVSGQLGPRHLIKTLTRAKFEALIEPLLNRLMLLVEQAIKDSGLTARDIEEIVMVGGSVRIPKFQQIVKNFFGKEPQRNLNPNELNTLGTALQAGILSGQMTDLLLMETTFHTLGVETSDGLSASIINRCTLIPTRNSEVFKISSPMQTNLLLHVLEGEHPVAEDNRSLAISLIELSKISLSKDSIVEINFDIDANGLISVIVTIDKAELKRISIDGKSIAEIQHNLPLLNQKHLLPVYPKT